MDYADGCAAAAHGVDVDFVGPCDGSGWNPPSSACDPLAQDCPEDEKCVPYASTGVTWDDTKCVPILGDVPIGEPCVSDGRPSATDDCDADGHCWNHADVDGLLVGVCAPFCAGTPDDPSCAPDSSCLLANEASIALCLPSCDPLTQDCGAGLGCLWGSHGFVCTSLTQSVAAGQPCTFTNDCAAGLGCFDAELIPACAGVACCAAYCSVDDPDACPDLDLACGAFFGEGQAQPGLESLGVCVVPNTWGVDTDGCRLSMPPTTLGI
jgi:hypothetical protein